MHFQLAKILHYLEVKSRFVPHRYMILRTWRMLGDARRLALILLLVILQVSIAIACLNQVTHLATVHLQELSAPSVAQCMFSCGVYIRGI